MNDNGRSARHLAIAATLRGEVVDDTVLLLDAANEVVIRLEGDPATAAQCALDGRALTAGLDDAADELLGAGLLAESEADPATGSVLRRRFLVGAAAATGIAVFHLPSAAAAASNGSGPGGGPGGGGNQAPSAPSIAQAQPGNGSVTLTIAQTDNGGSPITNYEYSVDDGSTWTPFSPAVTSGTATITGLTGTTTIRLRAVNAAGASTPSGSVTVTPLAPPAAPVITGATTTSLTAATLAFTQPGSASITGYEISTDDGATWSPVAASSGTVSATGLLAGDIIRLRSVNTDGESAASNAATAAAGSQTLTASGTFTVPADVTLIDLEVIGGAGGNGGRSTPDGGFAAGAGGQPARITGQFTATPGSTRAVIIGQGGSSGGSLRGLGDYMGGDGGELGFSDNGLAGGSGGGGGGTTSVKGSGLDARAGGGGGGGGAAATNGTGGNARPASAWSPTVGGYGDLSENGGGGGGGGGGGCGDDGSGGVSWSGSPGITGFNENTPGQGGARGGTRGTGLTGAASSTASGRTIPASGRAQSGEATFRWLAVTV